ncbi:universal stress protein [Natronorubrum daqingense]|uniref:Nucleotide-binding universal stress protein, UspA family n=1 Tax=Natronorubrum daqingense TaxID=588898 RepID=A0A1N6XTE5_9EURY|nr:universal stress protein [Natronorubrum daqingense]APX95865.1 universal stress protein UspA [Natronorubrum daqingense]SIR05638.1 Nucleotide-binding universal stress protein, UspA family [Natronorubrum daqingense]
MYEDVLIPTDGSDGTRQSIDHGLTIAQQFDASVHALSIVPEGPLGTLQNDAVTPAAYRAVDRVEAECERVGVPVETTVEQGVPHEAILEYASVNDVDMIVMGTQGRSGLDRVLVGSVTERVVRMADVPVVTVRQTDEIRIEDAGEADAIARTALADEHSALEAEDFTTLEEPHRTSATWIVVLETEAETVDVHVDALTGDARIVG